MEFRSTRHTNNLNSIIEFYTDIIESEILFSFENNNNYSGVFLGKPDLQWHLEFTSSLTRPNHSFDTEDILVFYPSDKSEYDKIIVNIESNNIEKIKAANPFWDENGTMIKDPDGFNLIVSNMKVK